MSKYSGKRESNFSEFNCKIIANPDEEEVIKLKSILKKRSKFVTCPYCKFQGITKLETSMNICNLFCCILTVGIGWLIYNSAAGKGLTCKNFLHRCSSCEQVLAEFKAC